MYISRAPIHTILNSLDVRGTRICCSSNDLLQNYFSIHPSALIDIGYLSHLICKQLEGVSKNHKNSNRLPREAPSTLNLLIQYYTSFQVLQKLFKLAHITLAGT